MNAKGFLSVVIILSIIVFLATAYFLFFPNHRFSILKCDTDKFPDTINKISYNELSEEEKKLYKLLPDEGFDMEKYQLIDDCTRTVNSNLKDVLSGSLISSMVSVIIANMI